MAHAIKVENLSKIYQLGKIGTGTIARDVQRWLAKLQGKEDPFLKIGDTNDRAHKGGDIVYSLKDINFEIQQGEAVGIIGKNGAGKSTLLKILSRVTSQTTGKVSIKGRIASLLEVGTGFHPELTGRENIFLNGAILGMRKAEIKRKLDEIIDFSGVERYIDTPVKRYSSGMYVRLAFAVAAHLESEILIVDEVLAVGDAEFQKKCLGKMGDVAKGEGRTVLFVSHNMGAIKTLCNRAILLENGNIKCNSSVGESINVYFGDNETRNKNLVTFKDKKREPIFQLNKIYIHTENPSNNNLYENCEIELETEINFETENSERYHITYHLYNEMGEALFSFSNSGLDVAKVKKGLNKLKCTFPKYFFQSGNYYLSLYIVEDKSKSIFKERDIFSFTVVDSEREIGVYYGREPGYIRPQFKWSNKIT